MVHRSHGSVACAVPVEPERSPPCPQRQRSPVLWRSERQGEAAALAVRRRRPLPRGGSSASGSLLRLLRDVSSALVSHTANRLIIGKEGRFSQNCITLQCSYRDAAVMPSITFPPAGLHWPSVPVAAPPLSHRLVDLELCLGCTPSRVVLKC